jgi:L-alanine-DL-glutamate epimerase-like enolase superfamily enzyme
MSVISIERIETWACSLPMETPLDFGTFKVVSREYVAVRLTTSDGMVADCLVLSRRSPIDVAIADVLAPLVIGKPASDIAARASDLANGTRALDQYGVINRGRSILDICLWDISAQKDGVPLWRKLGGRPRKLDVLLVEGYSLPGESDDAFAERLAARVQGDGFRNLKIEGASYRDPGQLAARLREFRRIAGDQAGLVVDLAWSWPDAATGVKAIGTWKDFGLLWVEDPMTRDKVDEIAMLRKRSGVPIGVGDETTNPAELDRLMDADALDLVRVDALAIGGISAAMAVAQRAMAKGIAVSMHEHPELHEHLAFAIDTCRYVEAFPLDRPFVRSHDLLRRSTMQRVERGQLSPPTLPGTGISLDDEALRRFSYRRHAVSAAAAPSLLSNVAR